MTKLPASMVVALLFSTASGGMEQPEEKNLLLDLPAELQMNVLFNLNAKELTIVSEVNKGMNEISKDEYLWRQHCNQEGYLVIPEGITWKDFYKKVNTTRTMRLTAYINPRDRDRMERVSVKFKGEEYHFLLAQADACGRIPFATDIVVERTDVLKGLPITYSVMSSLTFSPHIDEANVSEAREVFSVDSVLDQLAGTVTKELFYKFYDQEGRPAEPASIQLRLEKLEAGVVSYGYVLSKRP